MAGSQELERPGPSRPPEPDWTLVGTRRSRTGRHAGMTMSDVMRGSINLDSDGEEEVQREGQSSEKEASTRRNEGVGDTIINMW